MKIYLYVGHLVEKVKREFVSSHKVLLLMDICIATHREWPNNEADLRIECDMCQSALVLAGPYE